MRKVASCLIFAIVACVTGVAAFGHSYGPKPRVTAAPGDDARACTACHGGSALNSGPGSVKIVLQSGAVYIPGVKQHLTVQIADPNQARWGFELSARLNSDLEKSQAGDFISTDGFTQVICEDYGPRPCASGATFITHTSAGTRNGTRNGASFQFDWMPPAANAGPVTLYVAANAANGNGTNAGDLIYTSSVQLMPVTPAAPTATASNVVNSATTLPGPAAPNSWITVFGSNLGVTTRSWDDGDFVNGAIPFTLDGVSVLLFGAPRLAYVGYVSPSQVNILLPSDLSPGNITLQLRNPAGMTTAVPLTVAASSPQLFTADGKYVVGTHSNGSAIGKAGLLPDTSTTPVAPGETITVYATGLGATNPPLLPGQLPASALSVANPPVVMIGSATAKLISAAVVPGAGGLYQVTFQVPSEATSGDWPLMLQMGTASSAATMITVQK